MNATLKSVLTAVWAAVAILAFSIGVFAPLYPAGAGRPTVERHETLRWPGGRAFRIENPDGMVRVRTHSAPEIVAQLHARAYAQDTAGAEHAADYVDGLYVIAEDGAGVDIKTASNPPPDRVRVVVDYDVVVPENTDVVIDNGNGNVWVSRHCGAVRVVGRNTDVEIVRPRGPVEVDSTNGRIRVLDCEADASLFTVNGNIYAHAVGGFLEAETTNGLIVARLRSPDVRGCRAASVNGGVTVVMGSDYAATVEAHTQHGRVRTDFEAELAAQVRQDRRLSGVLNGGGRSVTAETVNGNIYLARSTE